MNDESQFMIQEFSLSEKQKVDIQSRLRFSTYIWGTYLGSAFLYPLYNYLKYPEKTMSLYDLPQQPNFTLIVFSAGIFLYLLAYSIKVFMLKFSSVPPSQKNNDVDLDPYLKVYENAILYSQGASSALVFVNLFFLNADNIKMFFFFLTLSLFSIFTLRPRSAEVEIMVIKNMNKKF